MAYPTYLRYGVAHGAVIVCSALEPDRRDSGPVPRRHGRAGLQSPPEWGAVPTHPNPFPLLPFSQHEPHKLNWPLPPRPLPLPHHPAPHNLTNIMALLCPLPL